MKSLLLFLGAAAVIAAGVVFGPDLFGGGQTDGAVEGVRVKRGPLRIGVSESGNLEAANSVEIASELEGSSTILYLIEEGTRVSPGDLLVELDATELLDRKVTQEITVENAKGALVKAEQNLAIQKSQNESDIAIARRTLDFAERDKQKYLEGDWPQQRQAAEDEILLAREELTRAEDKKKWSEDLEEKGFLTRTELEADALAQQRAEIKLAQSERALELLEKYDFPRQLRALEADVEEAGRELERVELQAAARLVDFEANVRSARSTYDLEVAKLEKLEDQLSKARIYAPTAGLVVYAREDGRRGSDDPIAEGTTVRERQGIITIPSSEKMVVEVKLHESVVQQVEVGQRALVRVDALPGREFEGVVTFKAILPESNSWWANPNLRVYRSEVEISDPDPAMRPGMSCEVEVVVAALEDAVHVPVQAIVVSGGETICFVREGDSVQPRPVEVGLHNSTWVEVVEGLEGGETVLLSPPDGFEVEYVLGDEESEETAEGNAASSTTGPEGASTGGARPGGGADGESRSSWSGAEGPKAGSQGTGGPSAGGPSAGATEAGAASGTGGDRWSRGSAGQGESK